MFKKFTLLTVILALLIALGAGFIYRNSQIKKIGKIDYSDKLVVKKEGSSLNNSAVNRQPVMYSPPPAGAITGLENYMDYTTNGNSLQQILVRNDTVIVAVAYCDSIDAPNANAGTTLRSRYNYSLDGGGTWEMSTGLDFSNDRKTRYPDLVPVLKSGSGTVAAGGRMFTDITGATRGGGISIDLFTGAGTPTVYPIPWTGAAGNSDAFIHVRSDRKVGVVVSPNNTDSIVYTTWNSEDGSYTPRTHVWAPNPTLSNTVSSYTIGASTSGNHMSIGFVFINEPSSGGDSYRSLRVCTSADNGATWSAPQKYAFNAATPNLLGGDSCQVYWHEDIAYKPGTTTPYFVFSTFPYVWDGSATQIAVEENKGWKICIQSPALNSGQEVVIADWHNIPILGDTALYNQIVDFQVNSALLSHPSLGFSTDGNTIWVAYSVIQKDSCVGYAVTFNYFDVYVQKSTNGGLNWSAPQNVSGNTMGGTPLEDEMYPIVAEVNNNPNYPYLVYAWNAIPGCHAFTDLQTVGIVYEVLKSTIIGVKNISGEIPASFSLKQNYPNPFNPTTKIRFDISKTSNITLKVYNVSGQEVATILNNENLTPGVKEVEFDGANLASGIYFYTMAADNFKQSRKMILVK